LIREEETAVAVRLAGVVGGVVSAGVKFAVTFFGPFIVREVGLMEPERSPDQFEKE
jgi:hypothetical protein